MITTEKLIHLRDSTNDKKITEVTKIFLKAMNDWSLETNSLEEFALEISNFIKSPLTKENIKKSSSNTDFSKNAWQAESLSELEEVFQYFPPNTNLLQITQELKNYTEQNCE